MELAEWVQKKKIQRKKQTGHLPRSPGTGEGGDWWS